MRKRTSSSWMSNIFRSRFFVTIAFVVLGVVAFGYARAYYQDYKIREEIALLQEEVRQLERKKIESLSLLSYVTSDQFIDETARTELNMKLPGEKVVIIDGVEGFETEQTVPTKSDSLSNPMKWWYYITHRN